MYLARSARRLRVARVRRRAVVRVPASTSNLGAGFDCIGAAVDRWLTASVVVLTEPQATTTVQRGGTLAKLDVPPDEDWIAVGVAAACKAAGKETPRALRIRTSSQIPVARGLGSSAAAVVAGATAATGILGFSLTDDELLDACAEVEGHPDNVAAAIFGGVQLALPGTSRRARPLVVADGLSLAFAVPDFSVETKHARSVLPREVPHATATRAAGLGSALVHGLATGDAETLRAALEEDVLHVPYRRALVRGFDLVCGAARQAGAFGATLSGSGSTVVAIAPEQQARAVAEAMCAAWREQGVQADAFVNSSQVDGRSMVVHQDCEDVPATAGAAG
ncbi:MAG TPA: homoserine kinase [Gemmatimonadaceae bacterium]|nr:homoserine kinase [Gemmatimonadaceae bacterium]